MTSNRPLNIAHRGARSIAPENTLLAAQKAFEIGADLWELDVTQTSDGEIVVLHDDTLERTSNVRQVYPDRAPWSVETFSLAELRRLDFGSWYIQADPFEQIKSGNISKTDLDSFTGLPIPTLLDALAFTKDHNWSVNVEIKDLTGKPGDAVIVEQVVDLVSSLGMEDQVIISSFNHSYLRRAKLAAPRVRTAALVEEPVQDPVALLNDLGAMAYNPNAETLKPEHIREVVRQGFRVFIWTVNNEDLMRRLVMAGASGLFTDFPQLLKPILQADPASS